MEKRINEFPDLGLDPEEDRDYVKRIAVLNFAFNNGEAITWLMERGTHIKNQNWKEVDRVNKMISSNLENDKELLDKLQTPCGAFVTWEMEEA